MVCTVFGKFGRTEVPFSKSGKIEESYIFGPRFGKVWGNSMIMVKQIICRRVWVGMGEGGWFQKKKRKKRPDYG